MMFFIVLVLLMFNMLLAIVFSTYDNVRCDIGNTAETLWSQSEEILRRFVPCNFYSCATAM